MHRINFAETNYYSVSTIVFSLISSLLLYPIIAMIVGMHSGFLSNIAQLIFYLITVLFLHLLIMRRVNYTLKVKYLYLQVLLCLVLYFRLNKGVYDIVNPTDLLGGVYRASVGYMPFRFTGLPEVYANYHQHFILSAGLIKNILGLSVASAIVLTSLIGFFIFNSLATLYFRRCLDYSWAWSSAILISVLHISSFPVSYAFDDGFNAYDYIMLIDIYASNSWVFGLPFVVILIYLFSRSDGNSFAVLLYCTLYLFLSLITNATVFSYSVIALLTYKVIKHQSWVWRVNYFFVIVFVVLLSRYIPSAFLSGPIYSTPEIAFRSYDGLISSDVKKYFMLAGPVSAFALFLLVYKYIKLGRMLTHHLGFVDIFFVIVYLFPIAFAVPNINQWDATHKNAILSIFLGVIVIVNEFRFKQQMAIIVIAISIFISIPNMYDFYRNRLSFTGVELSRYSDIEYSKEVEALRAVSPAVIYPVYLVSLGEHVIPNSLAGSFTKNSMYPGFLVHLDEGNWPRSDKFDDPQWMNKYVKLQSVSTYLQLQQKDLRRFQEWFLLNEDDLKFKPKFDDKMNVGNYIYIPVNIEAQK